MSGAPVAAGGGGGVRRRAAAGGGGGGGGGGGSGGGGIWSLALAAHLLGNYLIVSFLALCISNLA